MRGGREHRSRPALRAPAVRPVELLHRGAEMPRIVAHFVQRDQPVVAVESGIFHTFRRHRARELLEFHGKPENRALVLGRLLSTHLDEQHALNKIKDRQVRRVASLSGRGNGPLDRLPVGIAYLASVEVSAVYRKAGGDISQSHPEAVQGEVTGVAVGQRDSAEGVGEDVQFAGQGHNQDQFLTAVDEIAEIHGLTDKGTIGALHFRLRSGVDKEAIHQTSKLVSRHTLNRPVFPQALVPGQDLFGHHIGGGRPVVGTARGHA